MIYCGFQIVLVNIYRIALHLNCQPWQLLKCNHCWPSQFNKIITNVNILGASSWKYLCETINGRHTAIRTEQPFSDAFSEIICGGSRWQHENSNWCFVRNNNRDVPFWLGYAKKNVTSVSMAYLKVSIGVLQLWNVVFFNVHRRRCS